MPIWHSNFSNADPVYKTLNFLLQKTMGTCDEELKPLPPILSLSAQSPKEHHLIAQWAEDHTKIQDGVITTSPKNAISRTSN